MTKLALFDIDRTLVSPSRAHGEAFRLTFLRVYGVETTIDVIDHHGMTDQQILIDALGKSGVSEEAVLARMERAKTFLGESFLSLLDGDGISVLPGVRTLLDELERRGVFLGLVTGNLEIIGRAKLTRVDLNRYFPIGGFGSDGRRRSTLAALAIRQAERRLGFRPGDGIFLFGDTPEDVKAGKENGVKTIAVATGSFSRAELENCGGDFVLENLAGTREVLKIMFGT